MNYSIQHILLYCHFNKIKKGPGPSFQSAELHQHHVRNVCQNLYYPLNIDTDKDSKEIIGKVSSNMHLCQWRRHRFLELENSRKTKKAKNLQSETLFFTQIKKCAKLWQKAVLWCRQPLTTRSKRNIFRTQSNICIEAFLLK